MVEQWVQYGVEQESSKGRGRVEQGSSIMCGARVEQGQSKDTTGVEQREEEWVEHGVNQWSCKGRARAEQG